MKALPVPPLLGESTRAGTIDARNRVCMDPRREDTPQGRCPFAQRTTECWLLIAEHAPIKDTPDLQKAAERCGVAALYQEELQRGEPVIVIITDIAELLEEARKSAEQNTIKVRGICLDPSNPDHDSIFATVAAGIAQQEIKDILELE